MIKPKVCQICHFSFPNLIYFAGLFWEYPHSAGNLFRLVAILVDYHWRLIFFAFLAQELVNCNFNSRRKEELSPNILRLIRFDNRVRLPLAFTTSTSLAYLLTSTEPYLPIPLILSNQTMLMSRSYLGVDGASRGGATVRRRGHACSYDWESCCDRDRGTSRNQTWTPLSVILAKVMACGTSLLSSSLVHSSYSIALLFSHSLISPCLPSHLCLKCLSCCCSCWGIRTMRVCSSSSPLWALRRSIGSHRYCGHLSDAQTYIYTWINW